MCGGVGKCKCVYVWTSGDGGWEQVCVRGWLWLSLSLCLCLQMLWGGYDS